jgi:hypothetical protein
VAAYRRWRPAVPDAAGRAAGAALAAPADHLWLFSSSEAVGHLRRWRPGRLVAPPRAGHPPAHRRAARALGFGQVAQSCPPSRGSRGCRARVNRPTPTICAPVTETPATPARRAAAARPPHSAASAPQPPPLAAGPLDRRGCRGAGRAGHGRSLVLAWNTQQRVKALEAELVKRQQDSGARPPKPAPGPPGRTHLARGRRQAGPAGSARGRDHAAAHAARRTDPVAGPLTRRERAGRSDAAIRVAQQQIAITGSAEPLVLTLRRPTSAWRASTSRAWNVCAAPWRRTWTGRAPPASPTSRR